MKKILNRISNAITIDSILFVGVFYAFGTLYLYYRHVAKFSPELSSNPEIWAQFGDFVGGALGTVFSFLALMALTATVRLQMKQIDDFNKNAEKDELHRMMARTSENLDRMLASSGNVEGILKDCGGQTFDKALTLAGMPVSEAPDPDDVEIREEFLKTFDLDLMLFTVELDRFCLVLEAYSRAGGSKMVVQIYLLRYEMYVVCSYNLGQIDYEGTTSNVFNLPEMISRYNS